MQIAMSRYPQLRQLCWKRPQDAVIGGRDALALCERDWRLVGVGALTDDERRLLDTLVASEVHGCDGDGSRACGGNPRAA